MTRIEDPELQEVERIWQRLDRRYWRTIINILLALLIGLTASVVLILLVIYFYVFLLMGGG